MPADARALVEAAGRSAAVGADCKTVVGADCKICLVVKLLGDHLCVICVGGKWVSIVDSFPQMGKNTVSN